MLSYQNLWFWERLPDIQERLCGDGWHASGTSALDGLGVCDRSEYVQYLVGHNSFSDLKGEYVSRPHLLSSLDGVIYVSAPLHHQVRCLVIRRLSMGDSKLCWHSPVSGPVGFRNALCSSDEVMSSPFNSKKLPPRPLWSNAGVLEYQWEHEANL